MVDYISSSSYWHFTKKGLHLREFILFNIGCVTLIKSRECCTTDNDTVTTSDVLIQTYSFADDSVTFPWHKLDHHNYCYLSEAMKIL